MAGSCRLTLMGLSRTSIVRVWLCYGALLSAPALALSQASGQTVTTVNEPPAPLLPTNDHLAADTAGAAVSAQSAAEAAVLKECGLKREESRTILADGGGSPQPAGYVRAYQFVDATGALSAYTFFRQGGRSLAKPEGISESQLSNGEVVVLAGVSVVRAQTKRDRASLEALLSTVEVGLPKINGRRGLPPMLPKLLPGTGLAPDSLRYALGPVSYQGMGGVLPPEILGWDKSAEVATAHYAGRSGAGSLTLLMYPTPEIAGERGRAIQDVLSSGKPELRMAKLRRIGPLLALASGGFSSREAEALVQSVHLNQEVVLDKALPDPFHVEIRKTVTLLEGIAIFVGVGILAALVLGVFLGGGRAAVRVMQGKPAWVDPEFLHIDLRGRPEPLQPMHDSGKDMAAR